MLDCYGSFRVLLNLFKSTGRRKPLGDIQLVIAGPMEDGEQKLRSLARELGIADRVVFTGFVPDADLPALYSGASVYACPSLYEGFGFTVSRSHGVWRSGSLFQGNIIAGSGRRRGALC